MGPAPGGSSRALRRLATCESSWSGFLLSCCRNLRLSPLEAQYLPSRVDHPAALRATPECLDASRRAIDNAALRFDDATTLIAFDHLGDQDMTPRTQSWPSTLARMYGVAKGFANRPDVGHQAIGTDQQGTTCRTAPHALTQPPDQGQAALLADFPAKPQPGLHHHGQGHPDNTALLLD